VSEVIWNFVLILSGKAVEKGYKKKDKNNKEKNEIFYRGRVCGRII